MTTLTTKERFINDIATFSIEKYVQKHGVEQLLKVKHLFVEALADIIRELLNNGTFDAWEESKHPRRANGQFGKGGNSSKNQVKTTGKTEHILSKKSSFQIIAGTERGKPMSFEQAMKGTNPNYGKGRGYSENCAACTAVFIARMKGYDIEVLPAATKDKDYQVFSAYPNLAFIDPKTETNPNFETINAQSSKQLEEYLNKNVEQGGYYMLRYLPNEDAESKHNIIVFKNPKGDLIYFDAQKSKFYNKDFAKNIAYSKYKVQTKEWKHIPPKVLRIDDKELEPKTFKLFSKKSKK